MAELKKGREIMALHKFEARPTIGNNKIVVWELCYTNPNPDKCGFEGNYPNVALPQNSPNEQFQFTIAKDQTGLGIKFADKDPLWINLKGKPNGPGIDPEIQSVGGAGKKVLTFVDRNDTAITLKYQLNFTDSQDTEVTALDPEIKNGGTNQPAPPKWWQQDLIGVGDALALVIGLVIGLTLAALWFRRRRRP